MEHEVSKMIKTIEKKDWNGFFELLTKDRSEWETSVEVLDNENGDQILLEGLPFAGLTFDEKDGREFVTIMTGTTVERHQTHTIESPQLVAYDGNGLSTSATLDIEDANGTKTLVTFVQPLTALIAEP